jgi:AraC-like DNA-binding protein
MTIALSLADLNELWMQENHSPPPANSEYLWRVPKSLGSGYIRQIQVAPGLSLEIWEIQNREQVCVQLPVNQHPVEFGVLLSGRITTEANCLWNRHQTLISGGGMQRKMTVNFHATESIVGVDIHLSPSKLISLFADEHGQISPELAFLIRSDDWQSLLSSPNTSDLICLVQQIRNCPYQGIAKRMYLQTKAIEMMTLQLAPFLSPSPTAETSFKSQTVAKLYYAKEIIGSRLDRPPSLTELAQQLELSDRTLRRGFRALFGTTVVGYLTDRRLQQAEFLLRNTDRSVTEIANHVGYAHLGHFARAFKCKYGINPSDCRSQTES